MTHFKPRIIKRLLVANRGEIAVRILSSARELGIETFAVYTENDIGHVYNASHAIQLKSPASYMNIDDLIAVVKQHDIDALHPGYGFLSESADLASRMAQLNVMVIGPGSDNLAKTGDKLRARLLAVECNVPVLPALTDPTGIVGDVKAFAEQAGLPVMVKAVDGGGGRGIRLIRQMEDLQSLIVRAIEESPSKQVFAEKAAVNGFRHVEVQIAGDGRGNVMHLWERECSIQRRYQKIVELAPSTVIDRAIVAPVIRAAVAMAKKIRYGSLGTFEFLLNPGTAEFFFLEINPRLQVEHTITESICGLDVVKAQLLLAQGATFAEAGLEIAQDPLRPPNMHSIQMRITAEDPEKNYSLSIGKILSFHFPSGNGIRIDTALHQGIPAVVTSDFDSVIAKLIVTARTWQDVVRKAQRALEDTSIIGINTNIALLRAIVGHPDFASGRCDTQWLETKHYELLESIRAISNRSDPTHGLVTQQSTTSVGASISTSSALLSKDDAWSIVLRPLANARSSDAAQTYHLRLTRIHRNDFPLAITADAIFTSADQQPTNYHLEAHSTTASAGSTVSQHRQGSRSDPSHIILPISGKLVEVLVDIGDAIRKDDPVCVIKQMKMEIEVRSHKAGVVTWITEAEDDEDVAEGMLAAIVEDDRAQAKL
ncbi:hypothetical protein BAUCODRAFT_123119 [Baudoinia panamericana UAMH 10762]|uniref:Pyruvate carboxylase n=1 Tax=Baudoinia panamericana (strain UAMH 10762) TaxID=717646 RepID=M2MGR1_BAUPA|nr:uncharacterized protein BAUCODRAFT_123119 [Baudoinia panamericana UAMH 10762]EMC95831.1 hypothetical protein BAUCODRAFT_123119 [Baudoinia panamericana UAMH 10762]